MTHIVAGILFLVVGSLMVIGTWRNYRASLPRGRSRPDPSLFAVMDLHAPEYRVKPASQPVFPRSRRSGLGLNEPGGEQKSSTFPTGLAPQPYAAAEDNEARQARGLRIRSVEDDSENSGHTLGL